MEVPKFINLVPIRLQLTNEPTQQDVDVDVSESVFALKYIMTSLIIVEEIVKHVIQYWIIVF